MKIMMKIFQEQFLKYILIKKSKSYCLYYLHNTLILYYKINNDVFFGLDKDYYLISGDIFLTIMVKKSRNKRKNNTNTNRN